MNTKTYEQLLPYLIETTLSIGVVVGIFQGFYAFHQYGCPALTLKILALWTICTYSFIAFIGGVCFSRIYPSVYGWKYGSYFQLQNSFQDLSFAIVTFIIFYSEWPLSSFLSIILLFSLQLLFTFGILVYEMILARKIALRKVSHIVTIVALVSTYFYFTHLLTI